MGDMFSTGKSAAKRAAAQSQQELARQRQREMASLAEEDDAVARRMVAAESGKLGRRSLIRTSERGTERRKNLG